MRPAAAALGRRLLPSAAANAASSDAPTDAEARGASLREAGPSDARLPCAAALALLRTLGHCRTPAEKASIFREACEEVVKDASRSASLDAAGRSTTTSCGLGADDLLPPRLRPRAIALLSLPAELAFVCDFLPPAHLHGRDGYARARCSAPCASPASYGRATRSSRPRGRWPPAADPLAPVPLPTVGDAAALLAPGARFAGPRPPPTLALSCSGSELLAAFGTAQIGARRPRWTDDKVLRKDVWRRLGVADAFLVPTLCSTELRLVGELPAPEFYEDDDGGFSPNLDGPGPAQEPSDPHFAEHAARGAAPPPPHRAQAVARRQPRGVPASPPAPTTARW